jgi:hypothetical protein
MFRDDPIVDEALVFDAVAPVLEPALEKVG